jgi:hypothetical protein
MKNAGIPYQCAEETKRLPSRVLGWEDALLEVSLDSGGALRRAMQLSVSQ